MSTCSSTIRASFKKTGFDYFKKDGRDFLRFNGNKIENSPSFKELWQINYPEAKLSAR